MPLAAFLLAKLPACTRDTRSLLITPCKEPPLSVATKAASYTLWATEVPVTVKALVVTVMLPGVA